jgi:hypothetical protein
MKTIHKMQFSLLCAIASFSVCSLGARVVDFSPRFFAEVDASSRQALALRKAIESGDAESCRKLVAAGVDIVMVPVVKDLDGGPLGLAVNRRQADCLRAMLAAAIKSGRPVSCEDFDKLLMQRVWMECMEVLLEFRPVPEPNKWENYPEALQKRLSTLWKADGLAMFEKRGFLIPLESRIKNGEMGKIKMALKKGGPENDLKAGNGKALATAIAENNAAIVKLLLEAKADPNSQPDQAGGSVLMLAVAENSQEIVELLLKAGADPSRSDPQRKWTPLHEAVKQGNLELVKRLIKAKAKINVADENNETPLFIAITNRPLDSKSRYELAQALLEAGADAKEERITKARAIPIILFSDSDEMRSLLEKYGAKMPERLRK